MLQLVRLCGVLLRRADDGADQTSESDESDCCSVFVGVPVA